MKDIGKNWILPFITAAPLPTWEHQHSWIMPPEEPPEHFINFSPYRDSHLSLCAPYGACAHIREWSPDLSPEMMHCLELRHVTEQWMNWEVPNNLFQCGRQECAPNFRKGEQYECELSSFFIFLSGYY